MHLLVVVDAVAQGFAQPRDVHERFFNVGRFAVEATAGGIGSPPERVQGVALHERTGETAVGMAHHRKIGGIRVNLDWLGVHTSPTEQHSGEKVGPRDFSP